jgi:integrase
MPLPAVARKILSDYIAMVRMKAAATEPLFVSRFKTTGGRVVEGRMKSHRVWKVTKAIGARVGVPELHPHAFRHSCGVELLRRSNGNLRAVHEHLRHADIQTTTVYTRLTQSDLQKVISAFDNNNGAENRDSRPAPRKLPRQVDTSKVDFTGASDLGRNATGGTWPRLSWGRSVL